MRKGTLPLAAAAVGAVLGLGVITNPVAKPLVGKPVLGGVAGGALPKGRGWLKLD